MFWKLRVFKADLQVCPTDDRQHQQCLSAPEKLHMFAVTLPDPDVQFKPKGNSDGIFLQ